MKYVLSVFVTTLIFKLTSGQSGGPTVTLPLGKVEGVTNTSLGGRTFYSFPGVPYARPPVGDLRFREPQPAEPWNGTWQAKALTMCLQYHQWPGGQDPVMGDEDCLHVNIHTPTLNQSASLDVIVFIHGGAFMFNYGGHTGPNYLMDRDVVYVSLNYRVGPLGFLSTEDDVVPGNNGIKDQVMALRWIRDNIRYFGGNPDSVTITGCSAGGASVQLHYLMPKSKGLFHRGISQSGVSLNAWVLMENPLAKTETIAVEVGCPIGEAKETVECLKGKSGYDIVNSVRLFQPFMYNPFSPFGVVVDTWASDPLLPDHPYNLLKDKKVADLPWIASHVSSEGLYPGADFYPDAILQHIDARWNEVVPHILHYNETVEPHQKDVVSEIIKRFYFGDKAVDNSTFMDLIRILSDRLFVADIEKGARLQAAATSSPVYIYYFGYRGAHSESEATGTDTDFGADHMDDAAYIFKTGVDTTTTEQDRLMVNLMVDLFSSFAEDGLPKSQPDWLPLPKDPEGPFRQLSIGSPQNVQMESREVIGNRLFWEALPLKENELLVKDQNCDSGAYAPVKFLSSSVLVLIVALSSL